MTVIIVKEELIMTWFRVNRERDGGMGNNLRGNIFRKCKMTENGIKSKFVHWYRNQKILQNLPKKIIPQIWALKSV